jgi:hypothetical protein
MCGGLPEGRWDHCEWVAEPKQLRFPLYAVDFHFLPSSISTIEWGGPGHDDFLSYLKSAEQSHGCARFR